MCDPDAFRERAEADAKLYRQIGSLAKRIGSAREDSKIDHLADRLRAQELVIGFDSHVISLRVFEAMLRGRGHPVECLTGEGGAAAKRRAVAKLGLKGQTQSLIALCTDAFAEGLNLQRASCIVHLDTPTVIRVAEQRAGRVDRMDSPHDQVSIWWPRDSAAFSPRRRDLLRIRHELVRDAIGANLSLPDDLAEEESAGAQADERVTAEELADRAAAASRLDADDEVFFDAFRGVRDLVSGPKAIVPAQVYQHMRTSQAEVIACVSLVKSQAPWCFLSVGGLERAAPRWVFLDGLDAQPMLDLGEISTELRSRLGESVDSRQRDEHSDQLIAHFVDRLRDHELDLLPIRRRRALRLLTDTLRDWIEDARRDEDYQRHRALRELQEWLSLPTRERGGYHPDPGSIAEAWLRLLRPRIREALAARTRRRRPWSLEQLRAPLSEDPISIEHLWRAFEGVPNLAPIEERVLALIVGVAE